MELVIALEDDERFGHSRPHNRTHALVANRVPLDRALAWMLLTRDQSLIRLNAISSSLHVSTKND